MSRYCTSISFLDAARSRSTHRLADSQSSPSVFAFFTCALRFVTPYVIYARTHSNPTLDIVSRLFRSAINIVFAFFTCALRHCISSIQTNPARLFYFRLTPPEVLTLIPDFRNVGYRDKDVIALTHVCQTWREVFVSRPSLWTNLNCKNLDKMHVYLNCSKSSPINLSLGNKNLFNPFFKFIPSATRRM